MEQLQKYFLSLFVLVTLLSCAEDLKNLSSQEREEAGRNLWEQENKKHGFDHDFQGTSKAQTLLGKIIRLDPTNCDAIREASVPYLKRGLPHLWKPKFDQAVACNPSLWQPYRGYVYLWFYRDYEKAIEDFNASDTLTPDFIDAPQGHSVDYWRGIAYLGLEDYENSIAFFEKHIKQEIAASGEDWVEIDAFVYLGIAYFKNGNIEEALRHINKAVTYSKNTSVDANYWSALVLEKEGNHNLAIKSIEKAINNYNLGYASKRDYVETLYQLYPEHLEEVENRLKRKNKSYQEL